MTHHLPHSSQLFADWLSRHASMNRDTRKVLTCTQWKGNKFCRACCKKYFTQRYAYLATYLRSALQLPAHILFKQIVTSVHGGTGLEARSLFLNAVWMLSPCFRGPLGAGFSSHRHAAECLGLFLPLTEELASELELVPGRGVVIAHSS